jgi:spermidine synthase|tara:strand:- start:448 stop:2067 length:1620 start_codon:yes stop_codon:yes gene_type:complete
MEKNHHFKLFSIIFFTGAVVLSLELLASRILTPFFGVSLYIWTAILSVTLIFLAIGYQLGGWLTSKINFKYYEELFFFIPFVSSISIVISIITYPILLPNLIKLDLLLGCFIGSALLLAVPLVLMSSLNPILISIIKSKDDQSSDSRSGLVLFISTIGSVFGVIFTSLILIPNLTNFSSLILNAVFLILYSLIVYFIIGYSSFKKLKKLFLFLNLLVLIFLLSVLYFKESYLNFFTATKDNSNNTYTLIYERPTFYGNLKVVDFKPNNQNDDSFYVLFQNGAIVHEFDKNGNSLSVYTYVLDSLSQLSSKGNALVLGLGGGIIPKALSRRGYNIDIVEINTKIFDIAKSFFLYDKMNAKIFFEDARTHVKTCEKKYSLIVVDLFLSDGVPEHLVTKEFFNDLNNCLSNDGIIVSNSLMDFTNELALNSVLSTYSSVFDNLYYIEQPSTGLANLFVVASKKKKLDKELIEFQVTFDYLPKKIKPILADQLRKLKRFERKNLNNQNILSDEKNNYNTIFAKSVLAYRKLISRTTPSRILIN